MKLNLIVGEYSMDLEVPPKYLEADTGLYDKIDRDMDEGWQMGRDWVETPSDYQRCQIAASKLLDALETHNETLALMTAGYIMTRMPEVKCVVIDTSGEVSGTEFLNNAPH